MSKILEVTLSTLMAIAALSIAAVEVHREFSPGPMVRPRASSYIKDWRSLLPAAHFIGDSRAPITLIEFTDFECPYCRRFNTSLAAVREKFPNAVSTAVIHFPLEMHPHALAAAKAVECSSTGARFSNVVDFFCDHQDSIGKRPWSWFAAGVGSSDTAKFSACMADSATSSRIAAALARGTKEGVMATPTIVLNGWRYGGVPSDTELVRAVGDLLAGRPPYDGFPRASLPRGAARW